MAANNLSALFGVSLGLVVISVFGLPVDAQVPPAEVDPARSPEQHSRDTNDLDNSEPAEEQPSLNQIVQLGLLPFVPPPEEPAPQTTLGGGRRNGQCVDASEQGTNASVPSTDTTASPEIAVLAPPPQIVGLTEREKPTVWLYQPIASVRQVLLSVREEDSQQFHSQTTIDMPSDSQWVSLQLPEDAPPLTPETNYVWAAIALCADAPSPNDPALSTRIRRVDASSSHSASDTSAPNSINVAENYARNGQWYDAVDTFVHAQGSYTNLIDDDLGDDDLGDDDLTEESLVETWQALLNYAELSTIVPPLPLPTLD